MNGGSHLPPPVDSEAILKMEAARAELKSVTDEEPDTGVIIPEDAPERAKVALSVLGALPVWSRPWIVLATIGAIVFLLMKGFKLV